MGLKTSGTILSLDTEVSSFAMGSYFSLKAQSKDEELLTKCWDPYLGEDLGLRLRWGQGFYTQAQSIQTDRTVQPDKHSFKRPLIRKLARILHAIAFDKESFFSAYACCYACGYAAARPLAWLMEHLPSHIYAKLVKHFRITILVHMVSYATSTRKKNYCGVKWSVISSAVNYSIITVHVHTPTPY